MLELNEIDLKSPVGSRRNLPRLRFDLNQDTYVNIGYLFPNISAVYPKGRANEGRRKSILERDSYARTIDYSVIERIAEAARDFGTPEGTIAETMPQHTLRTRRINWESYSNIGFNSSIQRDSNTGNQREEGE